MQKTSKASRPTVTSEIGALIGRNRTSGRRVARAIGMSATTWYERMRGESAFNTDELDAIADHFGVDTWDLLIPHKRAVNAA